jgi:hypothetical protein
VSAAELATHVDQCLNEQDERMARDLAAQESKGARSAGSNGKSEQAAILFCVRLIQLMLPHFIQLRLLLVVDHSRLWYAYCCCLHSVCAPFPCPIFSRKKKKKKRILTNLLPTTKL